MELSLILAKQIGAMLLIAVLGFISVKAKIVKSEDAKILSRVCMYVVCPCVILNAFQMEFSWDKLSGFCISAAVAVLCHIVFIVLDLVTKRFTKENSIESASIIYPNAMNLVVPLIMASFGSEWVFYATPYCAVQSIFMWSHGLSMIREQKGIQLKSMLNINIIMIFISLFLFIGGITLPEVAGTAVSNISALIGPMSMLIVGMTFADMDLAAAFKQPRAYFIAALRLIVYPLVILLILKFSGLMNVHKDAHNMFLITMMAVSSCSASNIMQLAQVYDKHREYACSLNIITLVLCVATLPCMIYLYQLL